MDDSVSDKNEIPSAGLFGRIENIFFWLYGVKLLALFATLAIVEDVLGEQVVQIA